MNSLPSKTKNGGRTTFPGSLKDRQQSGAAFMIDRILPRPKDSRMALIDRYFEDDEQIKQAAAAEKTNSDCLVRLYLGEREPEELPDQAYTTLRNFEMRLNMIQALGVDGVAHVKDMAFGLAIVHWQAGVDGMDMEFVLGSCATKAPARFPYAIENYAANKPFDIPPRDFTERPIHLWMLDFDKANCIEFTKFDVDNKLRLAFLGNDPYFPRPFTADDDYLWKDFSATYLKASSLILNRKGAGKMCRDLIAIK